MKVLTRPVLNRQAFYDDIRQSLFRGRLSQAQVDGINALLDTWQREFANHDRRWLAYCLATAYHETAFAMRPLREFGRGKGRRYGAPDAETGLVYYGRGHVQLTWAGNYKRAGKRLGLDLYRNPDLALRAEVSASVLFHGCIEGWFTSRKLGEFINDDLCDYRGARRVVNGTDRADLISGYARAFEAALGKRPKPSRSATPDSVSHAVTGKPAHKSTTNWSAAVSMFAGTATAVAAAARDVADTLGPVGLLLLASAGIAAGLYIIRERRLKSYLEGV